MNKDSHLIYEAYRQLDENESFPPVVRSLSDILASKGKAIQGIAPVQDIGSEETRMTLDISMKMLIAQMFNDPSKFWELLKKVPGLYGDLLTGDVKGLQNTFRSLGVDVKQINDTVKKSMELFAEYQRGTPVEVRKAIPVKQSYELR